MKKLSLFIGIAFMLCSQLINAQDIFRQHGFTKEPLTLSDGRYKEFFNNDEVVQIGTVLLNTKTNKVVAFVGEDTTKVVYQSEQSSRWLSIDPLARKYPQISPYVYVANNPIIFIDPDGKKLVFANGASAEFKQQFATAVKYLNAHGAGGILASLQKSSTVFTISGLSGISNFSPSSKTINWDPSMGLSTNTGKNISATTILNHEADHANQYDTNKAQYNKDTDPNTGKDAQYKNKEEKRVIEGSEKETATKLGEIKEGESTRNEHGGTLYPTTSPTSTEVKPSIPEIVVTAPKREVKKEENK